MIQLNNMLLQVTVKIDKDSAVLAFSGGWLHAVSSIDGEILWRTELSLEGYLSLPLFLSFDQLATNPFCGFSSDSLLQPRASENFHFS